MTKRARRVMLYSLPGCRLCRETKEFLTREGILFKEINVLTDPKVLLRLMTRFRVPFPIVVVGDQTFPAWNRGRLQRALGLDPKKNKH